MKSFPAAAYIPAARRNRLVITGFLAAPFVGVAVIWLPLAAAASLALASIAIAGATNPTFARKASLQLIGLLLIGYAFGGKAFAHLGFPPLYIGEAVLLSAGLFAIGSKSFSPFHRSGVFYALLPLLAWCAFRTVPYLETHRWNALRDAAVWGYSLFAFIVAALVRSSVLLHKVVAWYSRLIFLFLVWVLLLAIARIVLPEVSNVRGPKGIPLFVLKPGDVTVHLAGIATFLALKLNDLATRPARRVSSRWLLWAFMGFALLFYASQNRGGLLAFVMSLAFVTMFACKRILLNAVICLTSGFLAFATFDYELEVGLPRKVSPQQLVENIRSIATQDQSPFEATKRWRLAWWQRIIDYTIFGPYRWSGKGFGVNLADEDGFQTGPARLLRSPHSAHFTFLARAGLPGLGLWLLVLALFAAAMMKGILDTTGALRRVMVWIGIYWVAFLVNASFDVYLEGPQGGVWFWCLFGLGISATQVGRREFQSRQIRPAT